MEKKSWTLNNITQLYIWLDAQYTCRLSSPQLVIHMLEITNKVRHILCIFSPRRSSRIQSFELMRFNANMLLNEFCFSMRRIFIEIVKVVTLKDKKNPFFGVRICNKKNREFC